MLPENSEKVLGKSLWHKKSTQKHYGNDIYAINDNTNSG